jgi:hypothetical protein
MCFQRLIIALFVGIVLACSTVVCEAQTVEAKPAAVVAQEDPAQEDPTSPAPRPVQRSPSDLSLPESGNTNSGEAEHAAGGSGSCQSQCSPCRPVRRCCRSLLSIFRRCR